MREHVREIAVVGQDQQAARHRVEAAHVEQALLELVGELAQVGASALVLHRRDHADGLVQHHVAAAGVQLHGDVVDHDQVGVGVDAAAQLGDDLAVHAHAAGGDHLLGDAAGGDARGGHDLLQAHAVGGGLEIGGCPLNPLVVVCHGNSSNPFAPSLSNGDRYGNSSSELIPSWASRRSVVA